MPDPSAHVSLATLEQLPYLTACVQESLRLGYGASDRVQRIATDETMVFNDGKKDWAIPRGTPVSMSAALLHHDENTFPKSRDFIPERWIETPHLDKYLVSFSKGSRQCIGINLAYAEMYLALARIFRVYGSSEVRFEGDLGWLAVYETGLDDVELFADHFIPVTKPGSKGVRVLVRK
jgi:cytochrome P450